MCLPALAAAGSAAAGAAATIPTSAWLSAGTSLMGSMAQVNAQNQASAANSQNARVAAAHNQDQEMEAYTERNRSMLQDAMDRALQARSASDLAFVSAMESGVTGTSVAEVLMDYEGQEARNRSRDADERKSLQTQTSRNLKGHQMQAKGRIASVPTTSLNMGHMASAIAPIVKHIS